MQWFLTSDLTLTPPTDAAGDPPFLVSPAEVAAAYATAKITPLASIDARDDAPGPVERGASFVHENVYAIELG